MRKRGLSELTRHVRAFLRVHHQCVKHLKVRLLHLDDVVDCPHLTGYDGLRGKKQHDNKIILTIAVAKGGGCQFYQCPHFIHTKVEHNQCMQDYWRAAMIR